MSIEKFEHIFDQLDLSDHVESFRSFFSRPQSLYIQGDQELHYKYISALDAIEFKAPPKLVKYDTLKSHLKKSGVLRFEQIFEVLKLVRYLRTMKNASYQGIIGTWMDKFEFPEALHEIDTFFNEKGDFKEDKDEDIYILVKRIAQIKADIASSMKRLLFTQKLSTYLVDTQVHYINDEEALLVRGGFNHVLKGNIIGRSSGGFFYVSPDSIRKSKEQINAVNNEKEALFYAYAKRFSATFKELLPFISFIDKEFDKFDHYQARSLYAKSKNLAIVKNHKDSVVKLDSFEHPALHKPKPISVDFSKNVLMVTGVNAGGKTMLLKSLLSATLMSKYLIPMKINKHKSHIGNFKQIQAIIDDPQSVKNDISTFAGRMSEFSKLFGLHNALIGVDEIELGTDSDEAAALFNVILEDLIKRGHKVVVTTHHKRLASLMAHRDDVQLLAALYNEAERKPTYEFLSGIVGKSYAFETAARYGISHDIVERSKKTYGTNHEKLNQLIERGSQMELELKVKHQKVDEKLETIRNKEQELNDLKAALLGEHDDNQKRLKLSYDIAIREAKAAAKGSDMADIHRAMNKANASLPKSEKKIEKEVFVFNVGDNVKYRKQIGTIISMKKKDVTIEVEGMRLRVKLGELRPSGNRPKTRQSEVKLNVNKRSGLKLDLHGLRAEEACERMDKFLSDALIDGWDEVIIYHGIGTGKLSYAVKEFLKTHPRVKDFGDAPQNLGGFGAKIVSL